MTYIQKQPFIFEMLFYDTIMLSKFCLCVLSPLKLLFTLLFSYVLERQSNKKYKNNLYQKV